MRFYSWCNFYLSSIQQGIQTAHLVSEIFVKYGMQENKSFVAQRQTLATWAKDHKTVQVMNGGNLKSIKEIYSKLEVLAPRLHLPYVAFYEDDDSLGGIMTSCGVVVPEQYYDTKKEIGMQYPDYVNVEKGYRYNQVLDNCQWNFVDLIKSCPFAK